MKRKEKHERMLEEIRGRVARKEYDKMTAKLRMNGPNDDQEIIDK